MKVRAGILVACILTLAACEPHADPPPQPEACSREEWQSRHPTTRACAAEFQALMDKARAAAERDAVVTRAPPPPARGSF